MNAFLRMFQRPITSARLDAKLGQIACWVGSLLAMVLGILKLSRLSLNETELFFGVLLVMTVTLLGVLIGLVLPLVVEKHPT